MSVPVREGLVSQMAAVTDIEKLVAQGRFDCQLALVRAHWTAVRRLWLEEAGMSEALRHLRSNLPDDFVLGCGMPGIASIKPDRDGCFEFVEDGLTAVIIPCYDCIPGMLDANPERHVQKLRDLVAVDLDRPDHFWRRRGKALVLGNAYLEIAGQECEPVPVFKNPMSWLKSGGAGIAILDWDYARDLLLDHELVAEDLDLGDRLEDALKPQIWIRRAAA